MKNNGGVELGAVKFRTMPLGAGGFATGFTFANSGAMVHQEDVYGGYFRPAAGGPWVQMFTALTLPAGDFGENRPDNSAYVDNADGCYAAAIAPSNDAVAYGTYNAFWYVCTNAAVSATTGLFTGTLKRLGGPFTMRANSVPGHYYCRRSIVDPVNPAVAMLGPMGDGAQVVYTINGTSGTPTVTVLTVPVGTVNLPIVPAVDPTSAVAGTCQTWAYCVPGHGIYESTAGIAGPYTLLTGTPLTVYDMKYDAAGTLWACSVGSGLYKKPKGGSLAVLAGVPNAGTDYISIAIDPQNTNSIVLMAVGAKAARSINGGTSWVGTKWTTTFPAPYGISVFATSIKWTGSQRGKGFAPSEIAFHPTNGTLTASCGIGFYKSTPPTTFVEWMWTEDGLGIESLELDYILKPPGGPAIICTHDRGFMPLLDEHRWTNPQIWPGGGTQLQHAWHADYVPGTPSHIVGCCSYNGNAHGYSLDGGWTWTKFTGNHPSDPTGVTPIYGGCIVAASALDLYWFPSNNVRAVESHDGGASWTYIAEFPLPSTGAAETGFGFSLWNYQRVACSDKATGDVYCWNYGPTRLPSLKGVWKRAFGTNTFVQLNSGFTGSGPGAFHARLRCVPGVSTDLFFKGDNDTSLIRSTNSGVAWTALANIDNVNDFGFGCPATAGGYPSIGFIGDYNGVRGIYRSDDNCATWITMAQYPNGYVGRMNTIAGDPDEFGKCYLATSHNGGLIGEYEFDLGAS